MTTLIGGVFSVVDKSSFTAQRDNDSLEPGFATPGHTSGCRKQPWSVLSLLQTIVVVTMMTRRHNGSTHEDVRRRLFQETPSKQVRRRPTAAAGTLSRTTIGLFVCFGLFLLVGVHVFLLRTFLFQQDSTAASSGVDAPILRPSPPLRRQTMTLLAKRQLQPLQQRDWTEYTIRINT